MDAESSPRQNRLTRVALCHVSGDGVPPEWWGMVPWTGGQSPNWSGGKRNLFRNYENIIILNFLAYSPEKCDIILLVGG